jgi:hypothetical protein
MFFNENLGTAPKLSFAIGRLPLRRRPLPAGPGPVDAARERRRADVADARAAGDGLPATERQVQVSERQQKSESLSPESLIWVSGPWPGGTKQLTTA